jgi:hypothetical protein
MNVDVTRLERDPLIAEVLVEADALRARVGELGEELSRDYAGLEPLLVCVLKGAVFFLADLVRTITVPCEIDFMAVSSYANSTDSSGVVRILKDLEASIEAVRGRPRRVQAPGRVRLTAGYRSAAPVPIPGLARPPWYGSSRDRPPGDRGGAA